ncbi:nitrite and sulfite reductase 4Fe-4S region [Nitritalea halalkaliphila LW7]|uniref:Nitrite and sulfite reductase 4Fe-4S region n=1 Tax=Nitritalea halalkaliphila LW7 TaxID=1189621 RepID=I5C183_9BACT|nr:nitrite/sulfite reductase [Nitritalea halalkaliphila]EIM75585.1 nitrite and sulfite reductase 4Fe-4S region [Nitritalea halalkaliphila LW7]
MQSFRTEIENPIVEQDIIELERKIRLYKEGKIDEEKFRSLRLARGVYGQRQPGVQMVRIKLPYGQVTPKQLERIASVSDRYSTGKLHITTRQDIQIHHVALERTPELWEELERDHITIREACGNTVRNITASERAGVDPEEAFDVSPYAEAMFQHFLRNPVCQEMGRKIKIAFSSSAQDTALAYLHDLGFIARIQEGQRGFTVLLAGGLGSQPRKADLIAEFMPADEILPFSEAVLRVFDRYGERAKRMKARLKFLVADLGVEAFLALVEEERRALPEQRIPIPVGAAISLPEPPPAEVTPIPAAQQGAFALWRSLNVLPQKQAHYVSVGIKVRLGDFTSDEARAISQLLSAFPTADMRFTLRQNLLIRHIPEGRLEELYLGLAALNFAEPGYEGLSDITACPGTDTCNLGIASSTGAARVLENVVADEFPDFLGNKAISIKISGCMNACGQHNMAAIGFQGMSIKVGKAVLPALQVLLGGHNAGNGQARFADKVIKIPSKRGPEALRWLLRDYAENAYPEPFHVYYERQGDRYFYDLLKPLSGTEEVQESDFIDWGHENPYVKAIGVGECAGVVIDLISTLLLEAEEKLALGLDALAAERWGDSQYYSYAAAILAAKAILLQEGKQENNYAALIRAFEEEYVASGKLKGISLVALVEGFKQVPTAEKAKQLASQAETFIAAIRSHREQEVQG